MSKKYRNTTYQLMYEEYELVIITIILLMYIGFIIDGMCRYVYYIY